MTLTQEYIIQINKKIESMKKDGRYNNEYRDSFIDYIVEINPETGKSIYKIKPHSKCLSM